jgi:hypothetical protein
MSALAKMKEAATATASLRDDLTAEFRSRMGLRAQASSPRLSQPPPFRVAEPSRILRAHWNCGRANQSDRAIHIVAKQGCAPELAHRKPLKWALLGLRGITEHSALGFFARHRLRRLVKLQKPL